MAWIATAAQAAAQTWEADAGFEVLPHAAERVIVGRQSVRDRELNVVGYEMLTAFVEAPEPVDQDDDEYDEYDDDDTDHEDHEYLPASVCTSAEGIGPLVGSRKVFYRADRALLTGESPLKTPAARIVIEIDEQFNDDAEVVGGCTALVQRGFTLALSGFPWSEPATKQLLELARIVKIDTRGRTRDELGELMQPLQRPGRQLLADHVETRAALADLRGLPFDFYAGYGLQHIPSGPQQDPGASQAGLARMSTLLLSRPRDFDEIEDMLRTEPGLAYQVMELASIGRMGETARRVTSLRRALVLIGSWRIQTWMAMLLAHPHGQRTNGAMTGALARARACEILATPLGRAEASLGYTAGMISAFDELTQVPRDELRQTLALSDELRDAAFGDETELGRLISDVMDRQEGRVEPRALSDRPVEEIEFALAAGYEWATRAGAAIA